MTIFLGMLVTSDIKAAIEIDILVGGAGKNELQGGQGMIHICLLAGSGVDLIQDEKWQDTLLIYRCVPVEVCFTTGRSRLVIHRNRSG